MNEGVLFRKMLMNNNISCINDKQDWCGDLTSTNIGSPFGNSKRKIGLTFFNDALASYL